MNPVGKVLEFLQEHVSAGLAHTMLKVYVAAVLASHVHTDGSVYISQIQQATLVASSCLDFPLKLIKAILLYPRPDFITKVSSAAS